jgi:hypothetical protein
MFPCKYKPLQVGCSKLLDFPYFVLYNNNTMTAEITGSSLSYKTDFMSGLCVTESLYLCAQKEPIF